MSLCTGKTGKVEVYGDHWKVLLLGLPAPAMLLSTCALCPGLEWPSFLLCSCLWVCISQDCLPGTVLSHPMSINAGCTGGKHPRKEFCCSCQAVKEKVNLDKACMRESTHNPDFKDSPDCKILLTGSEMQPTSLPHPPLWVSGYHSPPWPLACPAAC